MNRLPNLFDYAADTEEQRPTLNRTHTVIQAAYLMRDVLVKGEVLTHDIVRDCMSQTHLGSDAEGRWDWKDAYEAQEVAGILFLRRYRAGLLKRSVAEQIVTLDKLQSLMLTQTRRSDTSVKYQQFSTPFVLARLAAEAAQVRAEDVVLEPSAGTGILAAMAELQGASLCLNEYENARSALLTRLFNTSPTRQKNAEYINDLLEPECQPSVVLINPPFTNSPTMVTADIAVTGRHILSALKRLNTGGRLVAITGHNFAPKTQALCQAFTQIQRLGTIVYSARLDGTLYRKHGTSFDTRLTVIDKIPAEKPECFPHYNNLVLADPADILAAIDRLPPRQTLQQPASNIIKEALPPIGCVDDALAECVTAKPATEPQSDAGLPVAEPVVYTVVDQAGVGDDLSDDLYTTYRPQRIRIAGAKPHPTTLVQSSAMNAIVPPIPTAQPLLPASLINQGVLSEAQLESIIYAEEAHSQHLPGTYPLDKHHHITATSEEKVREVAFRRGWFLGDGTGCGKGRQIAGMILNNVAQGRTRAIWISKNDKLIEDARRDWQALGGNPKQVVPISRFSQGSDIVLDKGILFVTYGTLRTGAKQGKASRVDQIVRWAGDDFEGVIAFDESHAMANATSTKGNFGIKDASQQALAGLQIQRALSDARVVYVSATGATEVANLAYAERLGLWGKDTAFIDREDFIGSIDKGGIAAMEVVSRDMKAMGLYTARALSYDGVTVDMLEHTLTPQQIDIYDHYARAYQVIHQNITAALEDCNIINGEGKALNSQARGSAHSVFESSKQRFFNHLLTSMKCPSLIKAIEYDLAQERAPVIQVVSTSEALLQRRLDNIPTSEWADLNIDITPREYVMEYLMHAFPVHLHELYTDEEGKQHSRPTYHADSSPVLNQEAVARRDQLVSDLASLTPVHSALDQIIHHFGHQIVAEVTGRSVRLISNDDGILSVQKRSPSANIAETHAFMQGDKDILVFSDAGGTGRSYHADLNAANQKQRVHYLLEPGWRADNAIQGLGRTHRTHQASAPIFRPVATDVKGEKRFLSTIARRLDTLGAMTKGQRQTGGQGLFRPEDNLESSEAREAILMLFKQIQSRHLPDFNRNNFEAMTGLSLEKEDNFPPTPRFLNRLMALPIDAQNALFDQFSLNLEQVIEHLKQAGQYNVGIETLQADHFIVEETEAVYTDPKTGAESQCWRITQKTKARPTLQDQAMEQAGAVGQFLFNQQSGMAAIAIPTTSQMCLNTGASQEAVKLIRPTSSQKMTLCDLNKSQWQEVDKTRWHKAWQDQLDTLLEYDTKQFLMITGTLLRIWRAIGGSDLNVYRLKTDDGHVLLGRKLEGKDINSFNKTMGLDSVEMNTSSILEQVRDGDSLTLMGGLRLKRSLVMGEYRIEIVTGGGSIIDSLADLGCFTEIIQYKRRVFIPDNDHAQGLLNTVLDEFPVQET